MPEAADPFAYDDTPEVGVGFSDKALLTVSVAGFAAMALVVYCIVIARVKATDEQEKGQDDADLDYEDELLRSDVKTLNRAQRRARAKALMKRQRRVDNHPAEGDENDNQHNEQRGQEHPQHEDGDHPHLSRKERQKAAKAAEKKERQLLDAERQEEQRRAQEVAQEEKKKRLQLEAERAQEDKLRREQEQQDKEQEAFEHWETFLASSSDQEDSISVKEWTEELKESKIVSIEKLAERFNIDSAEVTQRIRDLVRMGRVTGVINQGAFICLTHEELLSLASTVKEQGEITYQDLSRAFEELMEHK